MAVEHARDLLAAAGRAPVRLKVPLGPDIGQCCGGSVVLALRRLSASGLDAIVARLQGEFAGLPRVYVFGAGHVGRALCAALNLLPVSTLLIDTRADELRAAPAGTQTRLAAMPEAVVREAPPGSVFVVLTHDHALDFLIASEALARNDAAYVGMIGSASKRASFSGWLKRHGAGAQAMRALVCPIGGAQARDKRPEVIAAFVAAELVRNLLATEASDGMGTSQVLKVVGGDT
jgi:xanthine dehydrogenase accessory factor